MRKSRKEIMIKTGIGILYFLEGFLVLVVSVCSILLSNSIAWMFETWNYLTMDELVYQLNAPIEGTNEEMIWEYLNFCIPGTVLILLFLVVLMVGLYKRKWIYHTVMVGILLGTLWIGGKSLHTAWERLDIANYSENKSTYSTFIDDNYVDPATVELQFPEKKRNLIYIFLESMEMTYADEKNGGGFAENCIPELTRLAQENEDFSGEEETLNGGYSMPQTTWTIGGMFAQTTGLPLSIPIDGNDMDTQHSFFPEVTAIGDILEKEGYAQTLLIGSDATFGGRRLYFGTHGNYQIKDYEYAVENGWIPEDYYVWWGYEDKKLFDYAKEELLALSAQEQPFSLTILTADTHFEDGYLCEDCEETFGEDRYANVMACSSKKVAAFLQWVQRQDFYEDTLIVLSGDHLTMDSDFCEDVEKEYVRKVYTTYINAAAESEKADTYRDYTTFDNFPTTLAGMGVNIEGERLGLGTNLFSQEWTLTEKYSRERMKSEMGRQSKLMEDLASGVRVDLAKKKAEEVFVPKVAVTVSEYDAALDQFYVTVSEMENVQKPIAAVSVAIWTQRKQRDLQWMQAWQQEDGTYFLSFNTGGFEDRESGYNVHVYGIYEDGSQELLGTAVGHIQ
ncbi:MAG: sulfatase-like hydrolase/transferase [Ruminococcus sp.]|nr:sulfatase-like hydrolase/transferase [Ruminococcus sp.]